MPERSDLRFYFDPVCPFAWMTAQWVRQVVAARHYRVDWRFISLRQLNATVDYASHFPPEYEAGHTAGLRMLRVAARARAEHGPGAVDRLHAAYGAHTFETPSYPAREIIGRADHVAPALRDARLPADLVDALDDESWDAVVQAETDEALAATGKDVGTPIIHVEPPDGVAFSGPVISRLPAPDEAVELWDVVVRLTRFAGFAEIKRSLRERPQLPALGVAAGQAGLVEDWHAGSRRLKR
ncbi:MAG: mycothiol-dependent nitroreductase Rv2466c family protein [Pseudonocardia sp.]